MATPDLTSWIRGTQLDLECSATIRNLGTVVTAGVPVSGTLTLTRPAAVVRTADVLFQTLTPKALAAGLDSGWTADLQVTVRQGGTVHTVPLGRFRAITTEWSPGAPAVAAQLADELTLAVDDRYKYPYTMRKGWTYFEAIRRLLGILGITPAGTLHATIATDTTWGPIPASSIRVPITEDRERIELFELLNDRIKTQTWFDKNGVLTIRCDPAVYYRKAANRTRADYVLSDPAAFRVDAVKFAREDQYNALVIQPGESAENFWYSWRPVTFGNTPYGARFGAKPVFYSSDLLDTRAQAEAAIDEMLPDYTSPAKRLTVSAPPYWWIEAGNVVSLPGASSKPPRYVINAVSLPLGLGDMALELESIDPEQYEVPEYGA
ncbi:hypothetical protein [Glycomyces buryatensis]|uniref:Uncharacterized protein n=1 Tax=Glycomyces buryatensis TaxID=2570927 RepID=A0A4S8Q669_9ACTN|nr:hypothetical protein [Glycomyces buryatensis]THV39610.1 hypothetical protein FAB82_17215 [Glycomyces buryatensis]